MRRPDRKSRTLVRLMATLALALAPGLLRAGGPGVPSTAASRTTARAGAPTLYEAGNAAYSGLAGLEGPVRLVDGTWEGEPYAPDGAARPRVTLAPGFRLTGDLDGDGTDESVVVLTQSSGGSGAFDYAAVLKRSAGKVENVGTAALGDRVEIRSARIEGGKLLVSVVRAGEGDGMCCPGELADLAWTLSGRALTATEPAGPTVTGRLTLDTLAGTEWVLRSWDTGEPAAAAPEVSLAYVDGRLTGMSGCNRYTASVAAGDEPGDLSIGPVAGTRMACPEPQSATEQRFLEQLGTVRRFSFRLGRLALAYQRDDGAVGSMLFERWPTE